MRARNWPTDQFPPRTAIGSMESLDMRRAARGTGHAGMEQRQSNCASVDCCTMRTPIVVTGQRMSKDARNIVRNY